MRIIAGKYRGIQLLTFDAENIRPTVDRVRENIFNKIQFNIPGARVLDLFGGTGAISLEFISRGADYVFTCDNDKRSIDLIKKNFAKVKVIPNLKIGDYIDTLNGLKGEHFDIIFLDPPYLTEFGSIALETIVREELLASDGIIVYERLSSRDFTLPDGLEVFDEKKYGTVLVTYMRKR